MKKALITGVGGQDGAYLAELLLSKGYEVHGIKRHASLFNTSRIDHIYEHQLLGNPKFVLHHGDLTDSSSLFHILQQVQPDECYNLGAQSHVPVPFEKPEYRANTEMTVKLTEVSVPADSRPIFITEIVQFGGAERGLLALAKWLYTQGLPVHIVTYADHCNLAQYATHPLQVVELSASGGTRSRIAAVGAYIKTRAANAPKLLTSGYQPALHSTLAGLRGFHCLMFDTPALFGDEETRSMKDRIRIAISNQIIGYGLRSGGKTIVNSEFLRADSRKDFGVDALIVRMGGLGSADGDSAPAFEIRRVGSAGGELRILSVCRIEPNKRIDWMLRSLAALEKTTPALSSRVDWHLDLAGKGSLIAPLKELVAELGIADRVHFLGFVSDEDLDVLYGKAHLFLMPAVQGYGVPAIESLQRGIPVVLHRESGVSDILQGTPWATVLTGGPETLTPALASAIDGVISGAHFEVPPPRTPTEDEWASEVAELCGWVPARRDA